MPGTRSKADAGGYRGESYWTRNYYCHVKQLNGLEWRGTVNVMSAVDTNIFTLEIVVRELVRRMQLPADRHLFLDDAWHSYAPLPASLPENMDAWYFIEEMMPRVAVADMDLVLHQ